MTSRTIKPKTKKPADLSVIHVNIILYVLLGIYILLALRILSFAFKLKSDPIHFLVNEVYDKPKFDILDRNGRILATDVETASLYAHPNKIKDKDRTASLLYPLLNEADKDRILALLQSEKSFTWLKKHISLKDKEDINDLGLPGIYFAKTIKRFYPTGNLFAHILGYTDIDGAPMFGLERSFEADLKKRDFISSLDSRIQYIARRELNRAIQENEAMGGACLVMDVNTGEIISSISMPDFNPNSIASSDSASMFNIPVMSLSEIGSLAKILTVAMALNESSVRVDDVFDIGASITLGKFKIRDYRGRTGKLSLPEVIMYSSNIGTVQIVRLLGKEAYQRYVSLLKILEPATKELKEVAKPHALRSLSDARLATASYGYGLSFSPLNLVRAVAATVNGGYLPTITFQANKSDIDMVPVFSEETSHIMRKLLRLVVSNGSGRRANVPEYLNGGKSGTAEKLDESGKYRRDANISSFVTIFPMHEPKYLIYLSLDEPKRNDFNKGFITGGSICGPVAKVILKQMGRVLGVKVDGLVEANGLLELTYPHQRK